MDHDRNIASLRTINTEMHEVFFSDGARGIRFTAVCWISPTALNDMEMDREDLAEKISNEIISTYNEIEHTVNAPNIIILYNGVAAKWLINVYAIVFADSIQLYRIGEEEDGAEPAKYIQHTESKKYV